MKKILTLFLLFTITTAAFAQENNFNITITVKGIENQIGILASYYGDKRYVKDTLEFNAKGIAQIKGKKDIPKGVYLIAFPSMQYNSFDIIINEPNFSMSTDTTDFIKLMTVKNSAENKQLYEDMNFMVPLGIETDTLRKQLKSYKEDSVEHKKIVDLLDNISKKITAHRKETIKKNPTTFYSKLLKFMLDIEVPEMPKKTNGALVDSFYTFHYIQQHYFDNLDFSDSGYIRSPVFQGKLFKYFDSYTAPQPDSIIKSIDFVINKARANKEMFQYCLNELFTKFAKSEIMGYDAIYVYMADKYYLSGEAWWPSQEGLLELRDRVEAIKPTLIGKNSPNFIVQDSTGKTQVFHDFISKNKYNILVFWNSDCSHCQKEVPELKRLYTDSLKTLGVNVFAVSTEQTDSSFKAFAAKNCSPDWVTCADMKGISAFRREYDVRATPKVFIISQDNKIIAKSIPIHDIYDFLRYNDRIKEKEKE